MCTSALLLAPPDLYRCVDILAHIDFNDVVVGPWLQYFLQAIDLSAEIPKQWDLDICAALYLEMLGCVSP